jgi:hypothetical protein
LTREYYTCLVCGRRFPKGQGIIIEKAGFTLTFHSSRCAAKFLRLLLERVDDSCVRQSLREIIDELRKMQDLKAEKTRKVI